MSRGLGTRQRAVLEALRALDGREPGRWWSPAAVLGAIDVAARPALAPAAPDPFAVTDGPRLEHLRRLVTRGCPEYYPAIAAIEARVAQREADRAARRRAAHRKAPRYPNQRRPTVRGGEDGNPARVFATLARRGLVERDARRGPGSAVRVAASGG